MSEALIPARFNGPPTSGNGGYSCGVLAAFIDGPARVRLHVPPPLDTPLRVTVSADGSVQMTDGEQLVGSAVPASLELDIPEPPSLTAAQAAMVNFPCYQDHPFATCFVCGPERPDKDGLELFTGIVSDNGILASRWQPAVDLCDENGFVRPEFLWSALDCPGYYAAMGDELRMAVLGELVAQLYRPVEGGQPLVVFAWPLGSEGRKFFGGTAIATADGEIIAASHSTWIELKG